MRFVLDNPRGRFEGLSPGKRAGFYGPSGRSHRGSSPNRHGDRREFRKHSVSSPTITHMIINKFDQEDFMGEFAGKVALITGGNAGIGRATAIEFAKQGAKVVITGRREKEGHEVIAEIKELGGEAIFAKTDVSKESDVKAMIDRTLQTFGRLDYAFNNAGIEETFTPLSNQTEEGYDQIMDINVKGVWLSLKHEIPAMLKTGGGAIVNNSSIAGLVGFAMAPVYVASKHAVIGLTKAVAVEYAKQNVRVNAVAPGIIETRMFLEVTPEIKQLLESTTPIGRVGKPEEIAGTVIWLCSDSASFVTGQTLAIDGGYTAQ